jgi:hypothetical protein
MAKRTRYGSRSTGRRPAANRLVRREPPKAKPVVIEPSASVVEPITLADETGAPIGVRGAGLSEAEIERASQLEAEMTTRERALTAARQRQLGRPDGHGIHDVNAPLAVRASKEYAYVARDVRRIAATAGLMVAILAVIDVLVNVLGVVKL